MREIKVKNVMIGKQFEDSENYQEFLEIVNKNKIKVYVFSHGSYAYTDEFAEVSERVEPCALPQAIYDSYIKVLPKRKPKFLVDELVTEIVEAEQTEIQEQGTLDFGDNEDEKGGAE